MSSRTLLAALFVALSAVPVRAEPTIIPSRAMLDTLARAEAALAGHPAADKVFLLADQLDANTVYVLSKRARMSQALTRLGEPDCAALAQYLEDVNQLSMAMD